MTSFVSSNAAEVALVLTVVDVEAGAVFVVVDRTTTAVRPITMIVHKATKRNCFLLEVGFGEGGISLMCLPGV